jgi:hypothetical protein
MLKLMSNYHGTGPSIDLKNLPGVRVCLRQDILIDLYVKEEKLTQGQK